MGGRALLRRKQQQWSLILCAGDGIKSRDALAHAGVPGDDAARLEQQFATAEGGLAPTKVAVFSKFDGVMMMDKSAEHAGMHSDRHK